MSSDPVGPDVTVVIPTRNRWDELARVGLRAALLQRDVRLSVVVVDDGSDQPPPDPRIFDHPQVTLIRLEEWAGVSAARNVGIELARGEWVAFLDDDDMWAPDKLAKVIRATEEADADFGYSSVLIVDEELQPVDRKEAVGAEELKTAVLRSTGVVGSSSNLVIRRSVLDRVAGYDVDFSAVADWEFVVRLTEAARPFAVAEALFAYKSSGWHLSDEGLYRAELERLMDKHPQVTLDWYDFESWIALSLRLAERRSEAARRYLSIAARFRTPSDLPHAITAMFDRGNRINRWRRGPPMPRPEWLNLYRAEEAR